MPTVTFGGGERDRSFEGANTKKKKKNGGRVCLCGGRFIKIKSIKQNRHLCCARTAARARACQVGVKDELESLRQEPIGIRHSCVPCVVSIRALRSRSAA